MDQVNEPVQCFQLEELLLHSQIMQDVVHALLSLSQYDIVLHAVDRPYVKPTTKLELKTSDQIRLILHYDNENDILIAQSIVAPENFNFEQLSQAIAIAEPAKISDSVQHIIQVLHEHNFRFVKAGTNKERGSAHLVMTRGYVSKEQRNGIMACLHWAIN